MKRTGVVGNSSFIVNDNDVIVVDDHVSAAAAWVLLEEIKEVANKPVTTVINTHFHFDHAHGNQIFELDVQIIGHPPIAATRIYELLNGSAQ